MKNLFYFGLEPLKERYTYQLSKQWIPNSFKKYDVNFTTIEGSKESGKISVGSVLDAFGRGRYSMNQCVNFMEKISNGEVKDGDIVYLQDFWTPGIEAVFYMLDLYKIKIKLYSMLHAQSVDEYDFTHNMKNWIRHFELGIDSRHDGIFVGSTIHKEQLRNAGFKAPIHVVSLPIDYNSVYLTKGIDTLLKKRKQVIFTSRLDKEKNPYFMLKVAEDFLNRNPDYDFIITTSGDYFKSSIEGFVDFMENEAKKNPRLILKNNLSKEDYYNELIKSQIQFNSSLQDYVSWTLLESTLFGCDVCYPNFRSFPEILDDNRMYKAFDVKSAVGLLESIRKEPKTHFRISETSDLGRRLIARIIVEGAGEKEFNIWQEEEFIKNILK